MRGGRYPRVFSLDGDGNDHGVLIWSEYYENGIGLSENHKNCLLLLNYTGVG